MQPLPSYQVRCTLTFGHIYGQILLWIMVIFMSLAAAMALMGASRPLFALLAVGLVLVLSLPFLLFAFVTTLLNHLALEPIPQGESRNEGAMGSVEPAAVEGESFPKRRVVAG